MNVKRLYRRENNANHEEDHTGIHLCRIQCSPLSFLSGSTTGEVRWRPSLAVGKMFEVHSLRLSPSGLAGPHCSALLGFHYLWVQEWFL